MGVYSKNNKMNKEQLAEKYKNEALRKMNISLEYYDQLSQAKEVKTEDVLNEIRKILKQQIDNSLTILEEILNIDIVTNDEDAYYFYDAVKEKLIKMKQDVDRQ
jgi:hypothetical protein